MSNFNMASDIIKMIKKRGFEADVVIYDSRQLSVSQRLLKIEEIIQSKNCTLGIRIIINGNKAACISVNSFDDIENTIETVIAMAKLAPEDQYLSIADANDCTGESVLDLDISDKKVVQINDLKELVYITENVALANDGITNSEGASASSSSINVVLATSKNFIRSYHKTLYSLSVSVISGKDNYMETDYEQSIACHFEDLKSPEFLGNSAAKRALARLNARKVQTCKVPVVFENRVARNLIKSIASAVNGDAVANNTSFLSKYLNKQIFNPSINIVDDALRFRGVASYPFDGEGITGRKSYLVKDGVLNSWLMNLRAAKKLHMQTTGNASRGANGSVSISSSNLYLEPGKITVSELIFDIQSGLYVTDLFGFGINLVTGDFSQGAAGFWIEAGKIQYPVHEVTIAGNLMQMFNRMIVANDLIFCGAINSPTVRIDGMTVAGAG